MMSISGVNAGAVQSLAEAGKGPEASGARKPGEEARDRPLRPMMDEYAPEEEREPSGRYWPGRDEDGRPRIYFDSPGQAVDAPQEPAPDAKEPGRMQEAKAPDKKSGEKEDRCVGNTDKVDREIEELKRKRQELEQRLNTETDETKIKDLERQLAQVERELSAKDNDLYRKQHSTFTQFS